MSFMQLKPSSALLTRTTYKLLRPIETVSLMLQAANLTVTAISDKYRPGATLVIYALALVHLFFAIYTLRHRGPLTRGRVWTATWIAMMFLMQPLIAHLLAPGDYGTYGYGLPAGNYTLIPLVAFAFYPWGQFRNPRMRWITELGLVAGVALQPLLIIGIMYDWQYTLLHLKSIALYGMWAVVWYLVGKGLARLCRIAVEVESEALLHSHKNALADLHSHIETAGMGMAAGRPIEEVYRDLREIIYRSRRILLLEQEHVSVADTFKNAIRLFGDCLTVRSQPPLGALTLPRDTTDMLDRGLCDLLKNVVMHGGGTADIDYDVENGIVSLTVRDYGPGLTEDQFNDPGYFRQLKQDLQAVGGRLILAPPVTPGTAITLTLPLRIER